MTTILPQDRKVSVPSPLPTRRGETYVPQPLREEVTDALVHSKSAIPKLQSTLRSALQGSKWDDAIETHLLDVLRTPAGEKANDDDIMSTVIVTAMAGSWSSGNGQGSRGNETNANAEISQSVVDEAVRVVRRHLETVCAVVDYVDWDGVEG